MGGATFLTHTVIDKNITDYRVKIVVKVHYNLRVVNKMKQIRHSDHNIEWFFSTIHCETQTILNFYELCCFVGFFEL